jgi:molecular chaperone DnaK
MSIGVGLPGGRFKKIVERNTSLPHKRTYSIATTKDDQGEMEIVVFQGESDSATENEYLGTLNVPDVPKGPRGSVSYDVQFSLSPEALLTVTAEEHGTKRTISATFSTKATPDEIREQLSIVEASEPPPADEEAPAARAGLFQRLFRRKGTQAQP